MNRRIHVAPKHVQKSPILPAKETPTTRHQWGASPGFARPRDALLGPITAQLDAERAAWTCLDLAAHSVRVESDPLTLLAMKRELLGLVEGIDPKAARAMAGPCFNTEGDHYVVEVLSATRRGPGSYALTVSSYCAEPGCIARARKSKQALRVIPAWQLFALRDKAEAEVGPVFKLLVKHRAQVVGRATRPGFGDVLLVAFGKELRKGRALATATATAAPTKRSAGGAR